MKKSRFIFLPLIVGIVSASSFGSASGDEIFVSNNGGNTVDAISATGVVTPFATQNLNGPTGIVFNSSGDLFVANNGSGNIEEFSATGAPMGVFASGFNNPRGLVIDGAGNLFVANQSTGTIDEISKTGVVSTFFTGLGAPNSLVFDSAGNLLVTEGSGNAIVKIAPGGGSATVFAADPVANLNSPNGIAIASNGQVYVINTGGVQNIEQFSSNGTLNQIFSVQDLNNAKTLAFDSAGNLYVTDASGNDISVYNSQGVGSIFATGLNFPCFITTLDAAPEPSTYALLAGGLGLLFFLARRKRALKA